MTNIPPLSILDLGRDIFARAGRRRAAELAAQRLASLDDHLLRDIGIKRSDIGSAVRRGR